MTTAVQLRRGTTAEHATFTGLEGETTVDTTKDTLVVHNGSTAGGFAIAREDLANVTPTNLPTITGDATAADDKFLIYDQSALTLKQITRAELNNAIEQDPLSNVQIVSGTINGTTIGGTTAAGGSFTTLNSSGATTLNGTTIPASVTLVSTAATQTLTNKTISGADNTLSNIANASLTNSSINFTYSGGVTGSASAALGGTNALSLSNVPNASLQNSSITFGSTAQALGSTVSALNGVSIGASSASTGAFTNLSYTGTLTGGTGVINIGSGQLYKDASGNVGVGTSSPQARLQVLDQLKVSSADQSSGSLVLGDGGSTAFNVGIARWNGSTNAPGTGGVGYFAQGTANSGGHFWYTGDAAAGSQTERMRITSAGNVGIGTSSVLTDARFDVRDVNRTGNRTNQVILTTTAQAAGVGGTLGLGGLWNASESTMFGAIRGGKENSTSENYSGFLSFGTVPNGGIIVERMRIDSSGNVLVAKTSSNIYANGVELGNGGGGYLAVSRGNDTPFFVNRNTSDGTLVLFSQDGTNEGNISVSGTTVSYNGGHLSRWAQTTTPKDESLVKGTVLSNLDEMNVYVDADGNPVENEQLNKVKVSDVEGDANVAGVFVNWEHDEAHDVDEINMAMTGDMIIRIAQGVTVQRGDLLMSAGDGTAKPQGDDIVRAKTIAKVTSTHVTCTYADGSYCVPCVLMAC
jgi:hypothetical protein